MRSARPIPRVLPALVCLAAMGCTTFREIPRSEYAVKDERRNVAIETLAGTHYEFDYVRVGRDTLTGYRRRDSEGAIEEYETLPLPLETIAKLSSRRVDWYRTGLVGGAGLGAIIAANLARKHGGGTAPNPCPNPKGCFEP